MPEGQERNIATRMKVIVFMLRQREEKRAFPGCNLVEVLGYFAVGCPHATLNGCGVISDPYRLKQPFSEG